MKVQISKGETNKKVLTDVDGKITLVLGWLRSLFLCSRRSKKSSTRRQTRRSVPTTKPMGMLSTLMKTSPRFSGRATERSEQEGTGKI